MEHLRKGEGRRKGRGGGEGGEGRGEKGSGGGERRGREGEGRGGEGRREEGEGRVRGGKSGLALQSATLGGSSSKACTCAPIVSPYAMYNLGPRSGFTK